MYLAAANFEAGLLRRLEHLSGSDAACGLAHLLRAVCQAHSSAAGVEWSSTDGDEGLQEAKVVVAEASIQPQLDAWGSWLCRDGAADLDKPRYMALAHVLIESIFTAVFAHAAPDVPRAALDGAWQQDAGGTGALPLTRLRSSLATLAFASCSDGTAQAAGTCLESQLPAVQSHGERWAALLEMYAAPDAPVGAGAAPAPPAASSEASASTAAAHAPPAAAAPDAAGAGPGPTASADAPADEGSSEQPSGSKSQQSAALAPDATSQRAEAAEAPPTHASAPVPARAARAPGPKPEVVHGKASSKSIGALVAAELSETSSADLDDVPDDLDNADVGLSPQQLAKRGARKPTLLQGMMASEEGKGSIAEMPLDLRSWTQFKDKQQGGAAARASPVRGSVGGTSLARGGHPDVAGGGAGGARAGTDQQHKAARGGEGPAPAAAVARISPVRQSSRISRHASNGSDGSPGPVSRSISRKPSVSEPAPTGPQAEWKHLPALGHATRLHPHEMRQPSHTLLRVPPAPAAGVKPALLPVGEDKLPSLPSLNGARGQPPKAMEMMGRRPSRHDMLPRQESQKYPAAHLPGLGGGRAPAGARALRMPSKKSFRGDRDF